MKHLTCFFPFIAAIFFSSCSSADKAIPYTVAKNYFLSNTVDVLTDTVITDQTRFNQLFGMATTMGPDGKPTPVDFSRQFVFAVARPETSASVDLRPEALHTKDGKLILDYLLTESGNNTFTVRPILLVVVDRTYLMPVVLRKK